MTGSKWMIALSLVTATSAFAHDAKKAAELGAEVTPAQLIEGVVKINRNEANIFTAETNGGHGTGFIVDIDEDENRVLIFTNKHVIESQELSATKLTVEFNTEQRKPEVVDGKLLYVSRIHDFAVVEVKLKEIKRAKIRELPVPNPESAYFDYAKNERALRGQQVLAIGNPFDGSNITTYGFITGLKFDPSQGPFIQTQTPINPGNSGGPLLSLSTGEVVGINTMVYRGADGVNFSIPIGAVLEEFYTWLSQKENGEKTTLLTPRALGVTLNTLSESTTKTMQIHETIANELKGYWDEHGSVMMITETNGKGSFQKDDILLTMNGQVIGGYTYDLKWMQLTSGPEGEFKVLRKGKVETIKSPVFNMSFNEKRTKLDFTFLSGMYVQQMSPELARMTRPNLESSVVVASVLNTPETQFQGDAIFPPVGSVITGVLFGNKEYKITNLLDFKKAINENRGEKVVRIRAYPAVWAYHEGMSAPMKSPRTGAAFLEASEVVFILPMRDVLTPLQFSINRFQKQFNFNLEAAETRNWRGFVRNTRLASSCEDALTAKKTPQQQM